LAEYICSKCGVKLGSGKQKIQLVSKRGEDLVFCWKCYYELPKEKKLELQALKKEGVKFSPFGFLVGGMGGGFGFAYGYSASQNREIMKLIKQYNLTLSEVNKYSIMNYNMHFLLCDNSLKMTVMRDLEKDLKEKKLNELANRHYSKEYKLLDKDKQKIVEKELKSFLEKNEKRNEHLKDLNDMQSDEIG